LNEALNQARVEETGLNIPKLLEVTKIDGKWAIVTELLKEDLRAAYERKSLKYDEYMNLFVDISSKC